MATRHVLIDDIDGAEDAETITFGLDGQTYEIELAQENQERLRNFLDEFVTNARMLGRDGKPKVAPRTRTRKMQATAEARANATPIPEVMPTFDTKVARAWLRNNNHEVPSRGVLRDEVVAPYLQSDDFKTWQAANPEE